MAFLVLVKGLLKRLHGQSNAVLFLVRECLEHLKDIPICEPLCLFYCFPFYEVHGGHG